MSILLLIISIMTIAPGIKVPFAPISASCLYRIPADSSESDLDRQNRVRLMVLPIIFSSPDTRLAVGVLPQLVFRISNSDNPSSIRMDAYYTQNKQYHLLLRPTFWLKNDSWNVSGKFSLKKWPTSFYGIGNNTASDNRETFTEKLIETSIEASRRIGSGLFAGLNYSFRYGKIDPHNNTGILASGSITGSNNTWNSATGFKLRRDTRDNHFYPTQGSYHSLEISAASKLFGSKYGFTRLTFNLRQYISVHPSHVLALQGVLSTSAGDVPFRVLPSVGSTLRGYSTVRYIDRNLAAFQLEYRVVPLFWRLGFVAFAGVADVFEHAKDLQFHNVKYSAGIGIRFQFSRSEKINIRLDYGVGRDSSGDYIDLNEAF